MTEYSKYPCRNGTLSGFDELFTILALVVLYFFFHYFFASGTAHVTALLPLMIAVVSRMDGVNVLALLLCGTQGIMGVITPMQQALHQYIMAVVIFSHLNTGAWVLYLA